MLRPRHSAPLRTLALIVLLWVGFDIGAHGLFASDFPAIAQTESRVRLSQDEGAATPVAPTDHCFCHGLSIAAVMPAPTAGLAPAGTLALDPPPQVPHSARQPLDRPPQLVA